MKSDPPKGLDYCGYAPSIVPGHSPRRCWACGRRGEWPDPLNRHEIFGGPYREKSKQLGLWVYLCHTRCHQGPTGVHQNRALREKLQQEGQRCAMKTYKWSTEDFIREFGKNRL